MSAGKPMLGEILIQRGLISQIKLDMALDEQRQTREFLGAILVRRKYLREEDLIKALSDQFDIPCVSLKNEYIDWSVTMRFSAALVTEHAFLPIRSTEKGITVAITNPLDAVGISRVEREANGQPVQLVLTSSEDMRDAVKRWNEKNAARTKKSLE